MKGKKRIILLLVLLTLCLTCTGVRAEYGYMDVAAEYAVIDNTSSLNLRQGPGYDSRVVASYLKGEWVEIQQSYGEWDLVRVVRTGRTGYMVDGYLTRPGTYGVYFLLSLFLLFLYLLYLLFLHFLFHLKY